MALAPEANPTDPNTAEAKRRAGCMIFIIVLVIATLGVLGWFLLWGRSIPGGEEADGAKTSMGRQMNPVTYPVSAISSNNHS